MATPQVTAGPSLYVKPRVLRFKAGEGEKLDESLGKCDANTQILPINTVADLALLPSGHTQSGYRYTSLGFNQVARALSPGLSKLSPDIAGCFRRPAQEIERFDLGVAISVFNTVLSLRFELIKKQRLVCNAATQQIEGLTGSKRRYLNNRELLTRANDALSAKENLRFGGAELIGRRLALWYRSELAVLSVDFREQSHPVWLGYYFCNSEAYGSGLRGSDALFNKFGCCLTPFGRDTRISHIGKNFSKRVERLFGTLIEREFNLRTTKRILQTLTTTPLRVVGSLAERDQQLTRIVHVLCRGKRLSKFVAQDIAQNALSIGADDEPLADLAMVAQEPYAHRTAYDLFCALLRRSRCLDLERREVVEQTAHELMLGRIRIGDR